MRSSAAISALLLHVAMARAGDLARAGRYSEAEAVLASFTDRGNSSPGVLDLAARIHAQQGRLKKAGELWARACELDPANEAVRAALRRIARVSSNPTWLPRRFLTVVSLGALIVAILSGIAAYRTVSNLVVTASHVAADSETVKPQIDNEKPPLVSIEIQGVTVKPVGRELAVSFDEGVFARGTVLTRSGQRILRVLGEQITSHADQVTVRVVGYTDDIPMPSGSLYQDNAALGLARALAVVQSLRSRNKVPVDTFLLSSLGETQAPYPNDTRENRRRNRTVVLWIANRR